MKRQFIKVSKELEQAKMAPTDTQINYKEIFFCKKSPSQFWLSLNPSSAGLLDVA